MRSIKKLLIILRDNTESLLGNGGLCSVLFSLHTYSIINRKEKKLLDKYISENRPKYIQNELFGWELGKVEPRINWLNEQIEKLMKVEFEKAERPLTPPEDDLEGVFEEIEEPELLDVKIRNFLKHLNIYEKEVVDKMAELIKELCNEPCCNIWDISDMCTKIIENDV